jgi:hypothetical protein
MEELDCAKDEEADDDTGAAIRKVERLIKLIGQGIKNTLPDVSAIAA